MKPKLSEAWMCSDVRTGGGGVSGACRMRGQGWTSREKSKRDPEVNGHGYVEFVEKYRSGDEIYLSTIDTIIGIPNTTSMAACLMFA